MFKVPEWGNDVPDTKVNFGKTIQKNKNKKLITQESPIEQVNSINKKQPAKKSTDKRKLKKIRQKNRQIYEKLSNPRKHETNENVNESMPGRFVLNPNKVDPIENRTERNNSNKSNKQRTIKQKPINIPNGSNNSNVVKKPVKRKYDLLDEHNEPDQILINAEKEKLNDAFKAEDREDVLFSEKDKSNKSNKQRTIKQKPINIPNGSNNSNVVKKPVKRKFDLIEEHNEPDQILINAEKKKLNDVFKAEDREDVLFSEKDNEVIVDVKKKKLNNALKNEDAKHADAKPIEKPNRKVDRKKELLRKVLQGQNGHRNSVNMSGNSNSLRERMLAKLQAAQFRYLNEKLYTSSGSEAKQLFQADPAAFDTYHQGYQQQIKKWPVNPLDVIVKRIMKMPRTHTIADLGCGSASLAQRVPHKVRSFDLVSAAPGVEVCDMAHTPLLTASMDAVVYCLALMGTELALYLTEGNRVLKKGGHLLIAEVESRFDKLEDFTHNVERLGFKLVKADQSHEVFYFLEFKKVQESPKKAKHLALTLKPCLYKRR